MSLDKKAYKFKIKEEKLFSTLLTNTFFFVLLYLLSLFKNDIHKS